MKRRGCGVCKQRANSSCHLLASASWQACQGAVQRASWDVRHEVRLKEAAQRRDCRELCWHAEGARGVHEHVQIDLTCPDEVTDKQCKRMHEKIR